MDPITRLDDERLKMPVGLEHFPIIYDSLRAALERVKVLEDAVNISPESLARCFHHHYERLAPEYGYKTREESRTDWDSLPRENKGLMTETAKEVMAELRRRAAKDSE